MKTNTRKLVPALVALSLLFFVHPVHAQRIISKTYTMDNGLSSNRVYCTLQDSCGFVWFGTSNGLNRFDGIRFKTYYYSDRPGSISSNSIRNLFIDKQNKMWIASDNGVDIYDPATDTFTHFDARTDEGESIQTLIVDIAQDLDGEIWIASYSVGVYRYSPENNQLRVYRHQPGDENSIPQDITTDLCVDSKGCIWIGTYSQGLSCFNKPENKFTNYRKQPERNSISDNSIQRICEDSYGNIWIGTFQNGLDHYRHSTGVFTNYRDTGSGNNLLYHIQDIKEYTPGELLIGSDNGLGVFKISEGRILAPGEKPLGITKVSNKFIYSVFIDNEESLWLGSYFDGVQFYSGFQNNFEYYACNENDGSKAGKVVNVIREDAKADYWIGTDDNGIFRFDARTRKTVPYRTAADIGSSYYCIHDILFDNGKMYVATYERGLEVFDLATGKVKSYLHNPHDSTSIPSSRVFLLYKGSNGLIYAGTSRGLCYFIAGEERFVSIEPFHRVTSIAEGEQGKIWIGTIQDGLYTFDIKTREISRYQHNAEDKTSLIRNTISALAVDRKKRLWIGTNGYGICRYDESTDSFVRYPHLDLPNNIITSIIPNGDYLWIATNKGLVHYNPDSGSIKTYSKANGMYNEQFTPRSALKTSDDKIFLGTTDGFCFFSPQKLLENTYDAPVLLTNMTVYGKEVHANDPDSPIQVSIEHLDRLILNHKQSMVGFEFASLSYIAPEENRYQYMLEGFDEHWRPARGDNNSISYTNLPAGEYTLRVKGTNSDKIWSTREIHLPVKVLPPFYKSTWAFAIYGILLMAVVFVVVLHFVRRSERKHRERIDKINADKEKELYDSKIEFFTNIAHEIRTPLSLIVGPLEYLMKSRSIDNVYGDYLGIIENNYKRLYTLVNELLDFRKVDSGIYHFHYASYPLKEQIGRIVSLFLLTARQKNIRIDTASIPEELTLVTDEEALTKIISNLVSNSLKYAQTTVEITAVETGTDVIITVTDDGPGIADEDKERIFDAFYQVKSDKEIAKLGIGIGLHMTRSLVNLMGGEISAHNKEEELQGAAISVRLPKKEMSEVKLKENKKVENFFILDNKEGMAEAHDDTPAETPNREYTVMAVDDNAEILDFLSKILSNQYFVISALSGEEALKILETNQVDLIVSDVMMDEMDGFELCRHIKTDLNTSHIPVVLLTAKTDTASKIEGLESGADAYIEKPFSPYHLKAQLQNLLKKRNESREKYASTPLSEIHSTIHNKLDEEFMNKCTEIIHNNLSDPEFSVNTMANELGMSRTSVFTKVKGITGMTPNDFIKLTRLKAACKMMVESDYRITEIGFLTGFSSSSYFAKCFHKQFGMLPTEFMKNIKDRVG